MFVTISIWVFYCRHIETKFAGLHWSSFTPTVIRRRHFLCGHVQKKFIWVVVVVDPLYQSQLETTLDNEEIIVILPKKTRYQFMIVNWMDINTNTIITIIGNHLILVLLFSGIAWKIMMRKIIYDDDWEPTNAEISLSNSQIVLINCYKLELLLCYCSHI